MKPKLLLTLSAIFMGLVGLGYLISPATILFTPYAEAPAQLMAEIRRKHPRLPFIMLTGHGSEADADRGIRQGAFDYLMKPVEIDTLVERVRAAVAGTEVEP